MTPMLSDNRSWIYCAPRPGRVVLLCIRQEL